MVKFKFLLFLNYFFLLVLVVLFIFPMYFILCASFSSSQAVVDGRIRLFPVDFTGDAYIRTLHYGPFLRGYYNSFINMFLGLIINLVLTMGTAYALSQNEMPARTKLICVFFGTLLFSGGILPLYLFIRNTLGVNNRFSIILPNALSVVNLLIAIVYIRHYLPIEFKEFALLEGSDDFTYFIKILVPVSKPLIAVLAVLQLLSQANTYIYAMLFINDKDLFPLQLIIRNMMIVHEKGTAVNGNMEYAMIMLSIIPFIIIYPFVQHSVIYNHKLLPSINKEL